ncbi:MAG: hypothetical protein A3F70_04435 [Acidobacteria bacterium RIFCSPLOWO2_12_FULL_67_14]|nr:MAG: hypothetical protein A3H29_18540 [Acidobacteria bacterium RIFCSPLOWO2_02_FULL_67_21]OFW39870.1 MAG: hypothetical protein A3F70_04435 [Acidobacteria bacterium RIFCSPLOWO2_12_FULL_67_14]
MKTGAVRAAAAAGLLFGALSVIAGGRVLAGIDRPDYVVLPWLVRYNVAAGIVGVVAGLGLWRARRWAVRLAGTLAALHGGVLTALVAWQVTGEAVAVDSFVAMFLRTIVWSSIVVVTRRALAVKPG